MAMKKSIGRTLAHIDVAADTSVRIHEDFFNSHRISQHLSAQSFEMSQTHTDGLDIRYFPRRDFSPPIAHLLRKGWEK
jgi:hypothetical protein